VGVGVCVGVCVGVGVAVGVGVGVGWHASTGAAWVARTRARPAKIRAPQLRATQLRWDRPEPIEPKDLRIASPSV
jgi:hypothetical protein